MEPTTERLIRSALHDLANVLAGVRGIIDLSAERPLTSRDRDRLGAVIDEGTTTLDRTRSLAMGLLPGAEPEPGLEWRSQLLEQLQPMSVIFRCRFEATYEGAPQADEWPGDLLRGYVQAVTRQVLPYVRGGALTLHFAADAEAWRVRWHPVPLMPENLLPGDGERSQDISARWASRAGDALGAALTLEDGTLLARLPRP
jgi:hypothetical protein